MTTEMKMYNLVFQIFIGELMLLKKIKVSISDAKVGDVHAQRITIQEYLSDYAAENKQEPTGYKILGVEQC